MTKTCPKCGRGNLKERTNSKDGSTFWGCETYPACTYKENPPKGTQSARATATTTPQGFRCPQCGYMEAENKFRVRKQDPVPHVFVEWATKNVPVFFEKYDLVDMEDLYWTKAFYDQGVKVSETVTMVVQQAIKQGLIPETGNLDVY